MTTRRQHLQQVLGAFAVGAPFSSARTAPSARINLAVIGTGSQGTTDMKAFLQDERVQVVAVCDVEKDSDRYNRAFKQNFGREPARRLVDKHYGEKASKSGSGSVCAVHEDFREVLERKDVDAVLIATPDHWHVPLSIRAVRAGKHVYCEKPVSFCVEEGRQLCDEVKKAGVRFQVGTQQRSDIRFRMACEFVRNGRLGKIKHITIGLASRNRDNNRHGAETAPTPPPAGLNYNLWLGPCEELPYCPARLHSNWRWLWAHGGGNVTDFGAHHLDIMQWALGMDGDGPVEVFDPKGTWPEAGSFYQTPEYFSFGVRYANGVTATVTDDKANKTGLLFEGENGRTLFVNRNNLISNPPELLREVIRDDEVRLEVSKSHSGNLIDAILSNKDPICPPEIGHRSATIAHLGNIALKVGRSVKWDPKTESIADDKEASAMLSRTIRADWKL
ncbi:MAG: Gfo/Idh/MocA family oxidoreductase [Verrucomicrobiaceae bacterium]|nr:Gfo/Idh/MocA family oxidoreductase [Verrucomicrobiaceae bacterium]